MSPREASEIAGLLHRLGQSADPEVRAIAHKQMDDLVREHGPAEVVISERALMLGLAGRAQLNFHSANALVTDAEEDFSNPELVAAGRRFAALWLTTMLALTGELRKRKTS